MSTGLRGGPKPDGTRLSRGNLVYRRCLESQKSYKENRIRLSFKYKSIQCCVLYDFFKAACVLLGSSLQLLLVKNY